VLNKKLYSLDNVFMDLIKKQLLTMTD